MKKNKVLDILQTLLTIISVLILLSFIFIFNFSHSEGKSMNPTIYNNEKIVAINSWIVNDYDRYDIVTFDYTTETLVAHGFSEDENTIGLKRVIGLPGEHIRIVGYDVYVNGEKIEQSFIDTTVVPRVDYKYLDVQLGEDEYFLMGDNRNISFDSRTVGAINKDDIKSKLLFHF